MAGDLPRLAVVVDFGAASPLTVLAAARGLADVVFLCDRSRPSVRPLFDELAAFAAVCDITGLTDDDILGHPACHGLAGIVTFSEHQVERAAALAHRSGLPGHSPATAAALTDKFRQRQRLAQAGVQHTRCRTVRDTTELRDALAEIGLPAILKPRHGAGSAHTCRVDTLDAAVAQLDDFLRHHSRDEGNAARFVVEEVLAGDSRVAGPSWGDYVSVESLTVHGRTVHVEVTGKFPLAPPLRETGYVVPSTLNRAQRAEVVDLTADALRALGIEHGVTHTELKLHQDGPRIIEVNGRVGGYVGDLIRRARRFDLTRAALAAALGIMTDVPAALYRCHAFQYFLTPPMNAVALARFDGVEELTRQRGITVVEVLKQPGDPLDWRHGTLNYIGIVHGTAADHHDVLRLVDLINSVLTVGYTMETR